jgi:3-oxoacyl-(acyl-carrier-protein) synthase
MKAYIQSFNSISPVQIPAVSPENTGLPNVEKKYLQAIEPDYKEIINPNLIRRMGRVIKMGVASSMKCLKDAGVENPDAIITGTALGCIEDTEKFLNQIVVNKEQFLAPTSFIQSTHNTIAGQIALLLKCHSYNFTFVHRNFSFENAVTDSLMMLAEHPGYRILLGGVDEITTGSYAIMKRLGIYKDADMAANQKLKNRTAGSMAGEGATFFVISGNPGNALACIQGVKTFFKPKNQEETQQHILSFLNANNLTPENVDAVMMGYSGDERYDTVYDEIVSSIFAKNCILSYKNLCGEYFTSSAFAVGLSTSIIQNALVPEEVMYQGSQPEKIKSVLIYNQFKNSEHSLMLLSQC